MCRIDLEFTITNKGEYALKNWFSIKAQADTEAPAEISIHDSIGSWNVNAQDFLMQLKTVSAKNITLTMNSPGGSVIDGIAIYNGLRNHAEKTGATITVKVLGIVASIASVIAMAGDKIKMPKNTFMMVHSPSAGLHANANELRDMADLLDKFESSLISTYVARTGKTAEEIKAILDAETFMTADEAVAMGFADEVTDVLKITASFDLDNLPENITSVFKAAQEPTEIGTPEPLAIAKSFAADVVEMCEKFSMQDHVEVWLLDASLTTLDQVKAALEVATEVRDMCVFAKLPDMVASMIQAKTTLAQAREKLCEIRASTADAIKVDGLQPVNNTSPDSVPKAAINPADVYAARKPKGKQA
jgi:ATP-dependent Clp protease protease subunit